LDKPGYEPLEYALKPESRETMILLELEAETQPRGTLAVDSSLSAEVWIDDVPSGYYTPTLAMRLPTGQHTVELKDVSGTRHGQLETVTIKQGETYHVAIGSAQEARR
jgi:hypothetical protein